MLSTLSNVIDIAHRIDNADAPVFQKTDATIGACVARAERDRTFTLTDTEHAAIAATLVCHDAQLARVPFHRYIMALEQTDAQPTPLGTPGRAVTPGDQPFARLHNGDSVLLTNIAERHDNKISLLITLPASDAETRGP
ncbi:hypothetical protein [Burkholderia ubonensis]|uniref:hypothetical protein n=1 Tax=Burkholderia ubonensis TaxID=101571 RepID=UPI0012BB1988|nr:hypothetical protein [Burkholderia ubonensis]